MCCKMHLITNIDFYNSRNYYSSILQWILAVLIIHLLNERLWSTLLVWADIVGLQGRELRRFQVILAFLSFFYDKPTGDWNDNIGNDNDKNEYFLIREWRKALFIDLTFSVVCRLLCVWNLLLTLLYHLLTRSESWIVCANSPPCFHID